MLFSTQNGFFVRTYGVLEGNRRLMDAGYTALDFSFFTEGEDRSILPLDVATAHELRKLADSRGVVFNQAHAPFGGGYKIYTEKLIPLFPCVFEMSSILGIRQIVVHPLQNGRYYGHEAELFHANLEFYRSLVPLSEKYGIKIAIENMWQNHPVSRVIDDDICADPAELAALYDALDDPQHFTVCLDIGHVMLCRREPEDAIRLLGERLGALHVHDTDYISDLHTLPGMAKGNWKAIIEALAEIGYSGEFTLEADSFFCNVPPALYPNAARFMAETARYFAEAIEKAKK